MQRDGESGAKPGGYFDACPLRESDLEVLSKLMAIDPELGSRVADIVAAKSTLDTEGLRDELRVMDRIGLAVLAVGAVALLVWVALFVTTTQASVLTNGMAVGALLASCIFGFGAALRISATTIRSYLSDEPDERT